MRAGPSLKLIRSAGRRLLTPLAATVIGILVALAVSSLGFLDRLENETIDARFSMRHGVTPTDVVVVSIDDDDIRRIGRWPFARFKHAKAVDRLHAAGARLIVYDVQFTERSENEAADIALFDAIDRAGGAVLATSTSDAKGHTEVLGGDENLALINARAAAANLPAEDGGIIRRYEPATGRLPAIAVVAARRVKPDAAKPSTFEGGHAWIDFRGGPGT